jgi:hypothetical protein
VAVAIVTKTQLQDHLSRHSRNGAPVAASELLAPSILAPLTNIDPVAVANVQSFLGAEPPYGELHVSRKITRELFVKFSRVYPSRYLLDNFCTSVLFVATLTVWMLRFAPRENSRSVEKLVTQCVDSDHATASFMPMGPLILS